MTTSDELETIGQLVLAAVRGVVIGLEREAAGQSAGAISWRQVPSGYPAGLCIRVDRSTDEG
jgi:hypothetical protein